MAADTQASIILRLKDEFSRNLKSAGNNFQSFARQVDQAGAAISRTGMKMVAVGTTMNAPFFAAVKAMEKYSFAAQNEIRRLNNEFISMSKIIAEAAMPTIRTFNDNFSKLVNTLKSADPVLLQNIAHWSMAAGQILIVAGTLEIFIGKVISLTAKLSGLAVAMLTFNGGVIPGMIAVVGGLIFAWMKFHDQFVLVVDSLRFLWLQFCDSLMAAWQKVLRTISKVPGANSFAAQVDQLTIARQKLKKEMDTLTSGGNSNWSQQLQNFSNQIQKAVAGFQKSFNGAAQNVETVMRDMKSRIQDAAFSLSDGFADAFDKVLFEGERFGNSMKSLFANMGRSILKDFVSTVGKNLFGAILGTSGTNSGSGIGGLAAAGLGSFFGPIGTGIGALFGSLLKFHEGGAIYAHAGLAPDEVPIIAQTGEGVLSRRGMAAIGGSGSLRALNAGRTPGGQTVNYAPVIVIKAWDSNDVYRNRKALAAAIEEDIVSNGRIRQALKSC